MKNTNDSGSFVVRLKKETENTLSRESVVMMALTILMGFLLPRSTIYGNASPFAVGLVAASVGPQSIPVFLSAFIGYLLTDDISVLRYLAALVTVVGIRWSVSGFPKIFRSIYYAPVVTFVGTLISGSAMLLTQDRTLTEVVFLISECLLAAGFSYFCSQFFSEISSRKQFSSGIRLGSVCVFCVSVMSLFSIQWQTISLGRIVAVLCIIICAKSGGVKGGCITGCLLGLTAFLSDPSQLCLIPIYAFGGLLSGLFSSKGRWMSLIVLLSVNSTVFSVMSPEIDYAFFVGLYEIVAATVFSLLVPAPAERYVRSLFSERSDLIGSQKTREAVALKMKKAAMSMSEVAGTVDIVSKKLSSCGESSLTDISNTVASRTCDRCKQRVSCWDSNFSKIMDSFNHTVELLEQNGRVTPEQLGGFLGEQCQFKSLVCQEINAVYREYLIREEAFRRLHELRGAINDQFETIAQMLMEFSERFETPQWNDSHTAEKIRSELLKKQYVPLEVNCRIESDGHMETELVFSFVCSFEDVDNICTSISQCCARSFSLPTVEFDNNTTRICMSEGQVYRTIIATAQTRCKGEKLCGDAVEIFRDSNGNQFAILSDGMGSGGRAAVDSAMAAGITARLLKAGFGYESILHIVNTALMTRENDETLATLDIACINLFTGDFELLKAGAGPSLLLSNERVSQIDESSLPLGILRELTFARTKDRLVAGDVLLLMSDGISNDGLRWVEELLRTFDVKSGNLQSLSRTIVEAACKLHSDDRGDDMTVIAVKLEKINNENRLF